MIKFKDTDFLHASSRIKSLERKLLTQRQLVQMIEAQTLDEAWKIANDAGIGVGVPIEHYEQALSENLTETYDFLKSLSEEHDFLDLLRYEYDALNLKILIKAQAMDKEQVELVEMGSVPVAVLQEELRLQKYQQTPGLLAESVAEATDALARTGDPQWVDVIVDRAMLAAMLQKAMEYKIPFLHKLVKAKIDIANLRSLVRMKRIDKDLDFVKRVLAPGGNLDVSDLADAFAKGMDSILALMEGSDYGPTLEPAFDALRSGKGLTQFERLCDDCITAVLDSVRLVPFGVELLIVYATAKEAEIKAVRIVMASRLAGVAPELIKERLRETYA
ncbi:MAG: V-type ATPase subunit [Oscillospiraceae bacterium]